MARKKRNMDVMHKTSIDNSVDQIRLMSMSMGAIAYTGTGAYKNKKYDKKSRRAESKRLCADY